MRLTFKHGCAQVKDSSLITVVKIESHDETEIVARYEGAARHCR